MATLRMPLWWSRHFIWPSLVVAQRPDYSITRIVGGPYTSQDLSSSFTAGGHDSEYEAGLLIVMICSYGELFSQLQR